MKLITNTRTLGKSMGTRNASKVQSILLLIIGSLLITSCQDFLEIDNPKTELIATEVFADDLTATAAISSIYTKLSSGSGTLTSITFLGPLLADEATQYSTDQNTREFYANNITPTNGLVLAGWGSSSYSNVYHANAVLEGVRNSTTLSADLKVQLEGEALFLRAFLHFYLTNLFGEIPYVTTTDYRMNTSATKMPVTEVYQNLIADLKEAQAKLPDDFSLFESERIRPTKWAATALLARVYLYAEMWSLAEQESSKLIDNNLFQLTSLDAAFLKNSTEAIWQLKPVLPNRNTNEGSTFILTGPPRFSALRIEMVNSFETGDLRRTNWIKSITTGGNTYYYPFKYKIRTGSTPLNEYSMVLRLSEQYLIRAEARAQQDNLTEAISDLDIIRQRSQVPLISITNPSINKADLLLQIDKERRWELFSEWGHRWFDLKRTGTIDGVLAPIKVGWTSSDALLPLPASEVLINGNLSQNPGY